MNIQELANRGYRIKPIKAPGGKAWGVFYGGRLIRLTHRKLHALNLAESHHMQLVARAGGMSFVNDQRRRFRNTLLRFVRNKTMARDHGVLCAIGYPKISKLIRRLDPMG